MSEFLSELWCELEKSEPWAEDEIEQWLYEEDALSGHHDLYRPDSTMVCTTCSFTYQRHPFIGYTDGSAEGYYLRILCDGDLVKL